MANGKYETALMTLIPSNPKEWNKGHIELLTTAGTIDRLTEEIIRDSKSMARKFEAYAIDMEARGEGWSPMGYSTLRDIEINSAKLEVHESHLSNLLRLTLGTTGSLDFTEALNA
jgi:hypothetical protein